MDVTRRMSDGRILFCAVRWLVPRKKQINLLFDDNGCPASVVVVARCGDGCAPCHPLYGAGVRRVEVLVVAISVVATSLVCCVSVVGGGMVVVATWRRCYLIVSRLSKKTNKKTCLRPKRRVNVSWALFWLLLAVFGGGNDVAMLESENIS